MKLGTDGLWSNLWLEGFLEYPYLQQVTDIVSVVFLKNLRKNPLESFAESRRRILTTGCWP
jgi:hypothetical protein